MSKLIVGVVLISVLSACGTAGGLVGGMGEDLKKAGDWIKTK